jgi:hypothetical protein
MSVTNGEPGIKQCLTTNYEKHGFCCGLPSPQWHRPVVIGLSFDMQGKDVKGPWIEGWRCVYDLKTGAFSARRFRQE